MINVILFVLIVFAVLSYPISYLFERIHGFGKKARLFHIICAVSGMAVLVSDAILCFTSADSLKNDVGEWAKDFFIGYLMTLLPVMVFLIAVLAVSTVIDHSMKTIRTVLTMLLPLISVLLTLFVAETASGGQFSVDIYIRWLAPGLALIVHTVPVFSRTMKKKQQ